MASYYFINTVVWLIFDLKHSEITQKKIKQFYYDNTMVNFCKGCDVHMLFCWRNYRGGVIYSKKMTLTDRPVSVTAAMTRPLAPFTGIYNM